MGAFPDSTQISTQPRFILALDGGGMRGIVPAVLLHKLQELLVQLGDTRPLYSHFDVIAGTSTGALLALALTAPVDRTTLTAEQEGPFHAYEEVKPSLWQRMRKIPPQRRVIGTIPRSIDVACLERLYRENGQSIFPRHQGRLLSQIFIDKYDVQPLEAFLKNTFSTIPLSDATVPTLIMTYDAAQGRPYAMSSQDSHGFLFWEAARASSAAPTYFKPAYLYDRELDTMKTLIDGGVVANNPSLYAYVEAKRLYPRASHYHILSLSTASSDFTFTVSGAGTGVIGWIDPAKGAPIQRIYASAQMQSVDQVAAAISELSYTRIHTPLGESFKLDETSPAALDAMAEGARKMFEYHRDEITQYATLLAGRQHFDQLQLVPLEVAAQPGPVAIPPPPVRESAHLGVSTKEGTLR